jgi:hypothetical protein
MTYLLRIALLVSIYLLVLLNVFYPAVRFNYGAANYVAFALAQFIPVTLLTMARLGTGWRRWSTLVVGSLLLFPAVPLGLGAAGCAVLSLPEDPSLERQQTIRTDFGNVTMYRTNGGATTAFGIVVRQECRVVPGLLVVRQLAHVYPADESHADLQPRGAVHIVFVDNGERPAARTDRIVHLRRFCWGRAS